MIQLYPQELGWVNEVLQEKHYAGDESFLGTFSMACLRADQRNYEILRPAVQALMNKYPRPRGQFTISDVR